MKMNKGFTLTELILTVGILTGIMVLVYGIFDQVLKVGNKVKYTANNQLNTNWALSMMMKDFQSMSFVMTLQRDLVPCSIVGGTAKTPKQTLNLINTCTSAYLDSTIVTLDPDLLSFNRSTYDYPLNSISFSVGLNDTDYMLGLTGTTTASTTIKSNYFEEFRDDDGDGKYKNTDGTVEDNVRDGIDNDNDKLDGEEPDGTGMVVGYQITYYLVPSQKVMVGGKYFYFHNLYRKEYKPHTNTTKDQMILENVILFAIIPFRTDASVRKLITASNLAATWNQDLYGKDSGGYEYGEATSNFNISFEIVLCTGDAQGNIVTFKRIFTPMVFSAMGN